MVLPTNASVAFNLDWQPGQERVNGMINVPRTTADEFP